MTSIKVIRLTVLISNTLILNQGYHDPSEITSIDERGLHVDLFEYLKLL